MKKKLALLIALTCLSLADGAHYDPPQFSVGGGQFDVTRKHSRWMGQLEWKPSYWFAQLRPFVSFFMTEQESSYFAVGLGYDFFLSKYFVITPSFGPGLYLKGNGKDLYFPLEFRSSIEAAIRFPNYSRLGVQFYHISNAGLGNKNPGSEILTLFLSFPLQK
jgi:hypothetical protein